MTEGAARSALIPLLIQSNLCVATNDCIWPIDSKLHDITAVRYLFSVCLGVEILEMEMENFRIFFTLILGRYHLESLILWNFASTYSMSPPLYFSSATALGLHAFSSILTRSPLVRN